MPFGRYVLRRGYAPSNRFQRAMEQLPSSKLWAPSSPQKDLIDAVLSFFPKVVSPQAHALFDALAFPAGLPLTIYLAKQNPRAGAIMGLNLAVEGGISLFTNYPPAVVPAISFRTHIRIGMVFAPLSATLALLLPGLSKRQRLLLSLLPLIPFVLNGISKPTSK